MNKVAQIISYCLLQSDIIFVNDLEPTQKLVSNFQGAQLCESALLMLYAITVTALVTRSSLHFSPDGGARGSEDDGGSSASEESSTQKTEGGWPLGLQPLNVRVGLLRSLDFSGSLSLNTIITDDSPTSSSSSSVSSSSDIGSESTGSFFPDRSITLGNLIGITSILELSRRSLIRRSKKNQEKNPRRKNTHKITKTWFSLLCPRAHLSHEAPCSSISAPSLGHFLEAERRASNAHKRKKKKKKKSSSSSMVYEIDGLVIPERVSSMEEEGENSLFSNGVVAPPPPPPPPYEVEGNEGVVLSNTSRGLIYESGYCFALMFPCLGGVRV